MYVIYTRAVKEVFPDKRCAMDFYARASMECEGAESDIYGDLLSAIMLTPVKRINGEPAIVHEFLKKKYSDAITLVYDETEDYLKEI